MFWIQILNECCVLWLKRLALILLVCLTLHCVLYLWDSVLFWYLALPQIYESWSSLPQTILILAFVDPSIWKSIFVDWCTFLLQSIACLMDTESWLMIRTLVNSCAPCLGISLEDIDFFSKGNRITPTSSYTLVKQYFRCIIVNCKGS